MTELKCSVSECTNNSDRCCCRPDINVSGKCACGCEQTSCADFEKRDANAQSGSQNSCGCTQPNQQLHVRCEAEKCLYNQHGDCSASDIDVCGCSGDINSKSDTQCKTFRMK